MISISQKLQDQNNNKQSEINNMFSYLKMQYIKAYFDTKWMKLQILLNDIQIWNNDATSNGCHKQIAIRKLWPVNWWTDRQIQVSMLFSEKCYK